MMSLFLHICTGLGLALAAAIRRPTTAQAARAAAGTDALAAGRWSTGPASPLALAFFARPAWAQRTPAQDRLGGLRVLR